MLWTVFVKFYHYFESGNCQDHTESWQEVGKNGQVCFEHSQFSFNRNWASKSLLQQYLRLLMYTNYMYEVKENFFLFQVHQVMSESCLFCRVYHEASYHEHWAKLTFMRPLSVQSRRPHWNLQTDCIV